MNNHRVPLLTRRFEDPATSRDPRVRELVGQLATLEMAPPPRAEFRAELRAQLVAITPRIIAESASERTNTALALAPRPSPVPAARREQSPSRPSLVHRLRTVPIGRPLLVAASIVTVLAMLFGGAVWMSQKAVPGDTLYGLKRASEDVRLALDDSDTERAQHYLEFAARRVDEAKTLVGRTSASGVGPQADGVSGEKSKQIASALSSSDYDVKNAWQLLARQATRTRSAQHLGTMTNWAPSQLRRLNTLTAAIPDAALRQRAESSADLVEFALSKARDLAKTIGTAPRAPSPGGSAGTPGPAPCTGSCPTGGQRPGGSTGATTKPAGTGSATTRGTQPSGGASGTPKPGLTVPSVGVNLPTSLPTTIPSVRVSVGPSCISASVVIGVHVGNCQSG